MITRNWSIRSKIVALVTVPLAALLALWIFATTLTVGPALSLLSAQSLLDELGFPGQAMVSELQRERRLSLVYLAGDTDTTELGQQRVSTDRAIAEFRRRALNPGFRDGVDPTLDSRLGQLATSLDALPSGRGFIDRRDLDRTGALGLYTSTIDAAFRTFAALAALPDDQINSEVRALTSLGQAREVLGQADALLAGVFTAGRFADGEHGQLVQILGTKRYLYAAAVADLNSDDRAAYQRLVEGETFVRLQTLENRLVAEGRTGAVSPVDPGNWVSTYDSAQEQLRDFESTASTALERRTVPVAVDILVRLALAAVLGLIAVGFSLFIALRVGRQLIHRLGGLQSSALEIAEKRLPSVVARLRRGEEVDVEAEAPVLEYGNDEIGQVGRAFDQVHRRAVRSAVDEADLRRGLNDVFLNIARRSQTLLHRQLALLDKMERRTTNPDELEDLFRVDHMATRMRRHAEDLVILAGAVPGRGWRNPVAMIDVVRGAVSEVEDYVRVDVHAIQPMSVVGRAVADLTHLLAELIENATSFSPPHTRVHVTGQEVPNGYAIEVEDRGLGMAPEALAEANRRLAEPPDFDPANSARLGLFVVAQLSVRHGVRVQLRPSPYGGVTAVVLLPNELVVAVPGGRTLPGQPAGQPRVDVDTMEVKALDPARRPSPMLLPAGPPTAATPAEPERRIRTTARLTAVPTQPAPRREPPAPSPAPAPPAPVVLPLDDDGLPRRVRQTSLAPQLRASAIQDLAGLASEVRERCPEEVRARMSALQAGTARGRLESEALTNPPAGQPGPVTESQPVPPAPAAHDGTAVTDGAPADSERNS
ncbi:nitrate- and nitrite sensing domain-containing protein [Polymorphospora rubra]|uniref:sensor histidine kinase n=1 Tax=Polymorphospora rubra TaxID=338584 RepID=UPI001BB3E636